MSSSIIKHFRNYASAGLIAAIAGILSFPILTRNLSVEDYGLLGLVTSTVAVIVAIGKLGIQHAVIRFFSQIERKNSEYSGYQLYSTTFITLFFLATIFTVIWGLLGNYLLPQYMGSESIPKLFTIACGVVFLRVIGSGIVNFLRAKQSSGVVSIALVIHRYLHLLMIIIALWLHMLSAATVIMFLLVAEVITFLYVGKKLWPDLQFKMNAFSPRLLHSVIIFGLPLMAYESLALILRLSDRYVIEALLGVEKLGQYSASYNLSAYLDVIIISGLIQAVRPMYTQIWEFEGKAKTLQFLENSFSIYVIVGLPLILGFSLLAPDFLVLLSGDRYAPGTKIIPYVALSFFLEGSVLFLGAGLHINKKTHIFLTWVVITALLNITLNLIFVPIYGMIGAAIVTIVSYIVFMLGVTHHSFRMLGFKMSAVRILPAPILGFLVYLLLNQMEFDDLLASLFIKGGIAFILFSFFVLIDKQIRDFVFSWVKDLKMRNIV